MDEQERKRAEVRFLREKERVVEDFHRKRGAELGLDHAEIERRVTKARKIARQRHLQVLERRRRSGQVPD